MTMNISVLGLNHKTAPVCIRERLAFDTEQSRTALTELKARYPDAEFVILSTCNRVELYFAVREESGPETEDLIDFLSQFRGVAAGDSRVFICPL